MTAHLEDALADRLLKSSARQNYDPELDIDWSAPVNHDMWGMPPERLSLYGTDLWDGLSEEQRILYSRHETASIASVGIWFELILMQLMIKDLYDADPRAQRSHYALTEVGDETRHSLMFGKAIGHLGLPAYGPRKQIHTVGKVFDKLASGVSAYASILVAEEVLDTWQRELMKDERVDPLIRMVSRIHVLEEARHMTFARDEVQRQWPKLNFVQQQYHQVVCGQVVYMLARSLVNPEVYSSVGIDPAEGRRAALGNPHYRETLRWMGAKPVAWLKGEGLIPWHQQRAWNASLLLG
ncbi:MAG: diiron oxygenase [Myxococcales bacterium]|nr:MAG: diiron oxygenase [Myxococcales bacterium]